MTQSLIFISIESPHIVSNGYNLRIHKLLTNAAKRSNFQVHCIAPVTTLNYKSASNWAISQNIRLHCIHLKSDMVYEKSFRKIFREESNKIISSFVDDQSAILIHGLILISDFSDLKWTGLSIADLIDETGPLMIKNTMQHLIHGRVKQFFRIAKQLLIYYLRTLEQVGRYDHISVVAHDDAHRLKKMLPRQSIQVIPNGVDLPSSCQRPYSIEKPIILFHGVYTYQPNEEAALFLIKEISPILQSQLPQCRIVIAGRNPTQSMYMAAHKNKNIEITGEVDQMSEYLQRATIGVFPIFTRTGLQNKILEAWSHRVPVVTTPEVLKVFEEFSEEANQCALTAKSSNDFVDSIHALIRDPRYRSELAEKSFEFVKKNFSWENVVNKVISLKKI